MDDIGCMNRLFKILEQNRHYQEVLLTACIEYLTSGKCPRQEIEPLKKAINKFMIYTLEIEKFFEFIDWKSYFYRKTRNLSTKKYGGYISITIKKIRPTGEFPRPA